MAIERILISFFSAAILPLCWIVYAMLNYPVEMSWMLKAIFHPLHLVIENNDSRWYSQLNNFAVFFGFTAYVVVCYYLLRKKVVFTQRRFFMLMWILIPLIIFSLAEIKRGTYLMITAPAIIAMTTALYYEDWSWKKFKLARLTAIVSFISMAVYSIEKLYLFSKDKSRTREWSTEIKNRSYAPGTVVYNQPHYIETMFYHDVIVYPYSEDWYQGHR